MWVGPHNDELSKRQAPTSNGRDLALIDTWSAAIVPPPRLVASRTQNYAPNRRMVPARVRPRPIETQIYAGRRRGAARRPNTQAPDPSPCDACSSDRNRRRRLSNDP